MENLSISKQSKKIAKKALNDLGEIIKSYNEIVDSVSHQKPMQTLDYDELLSILDNSIEEASILAETIKDTGIKIENLESLVKAIENAMLAYKPILIGLGNKANNKAKYTWFKYRKDLNKHDEARKILSRRGQAFWANVETVPDEPQFISVQALVIDPLANNVIEESIEMLNSQYDESEKDNEGRVYIIRAYEYGKPSQIAASKKLWDSMRVTFYGGTEEEQENAMKTFKELDD